MLSQLWAAPEGLTPREVLDQLDDDLAYTTVMTILNRLWNKGLVDRAKEGRAYRYRPLQTESDLIAGRKWIEMIRRGVSFFVLEKMAAVLGVSNPAVYAAFRGETLEQFLATRKVPLTYSVAGGDKARSMQQGKA